MIEVIKSICQCIIFGITYKFTAGGVSFSLWDIFMIFAICTLVGFIIHLIINVLSGLFGGDE